MVWVKNVPLLLENKSRSGSPYIADVNDVHTTKSRTRAIYSLKELANFLPRLIKDFLHVQYIELTTYWRHSKTRMIKRLYLNTVLLLLHNIKNFVEIHKSLTVACLFFIIHFPTLQTKKKMPGLQFLKERSNLKEKGREVKCTLSLQLKIKT